MRVRVLVRPKAGILDPQGQAVEQALPALGFQDVSNVHVGRLIELDVEDPSQVPAMCAKLLANPLIEDYEIETEDGGPLPPGEEGPLAAHGEPGVPRPEDLHVRTAE
jgi:phosphoribosylformylglycinamidine synthase PurS subunit